jgi:hypothetical protein
VNRWPGDPALDAVSLVERARAGEVEAVNAVMDTYGFSAHQRELVCYVVAAGAHRLTDAELTELRERVLRSELDADPTGGPATEPPRPRRLEVFHAKARHTRNRRVTHLDFDGGGRGRIAGTRATFVLPIPDDG